MPALHEAIRAPGEVANKAPTHLCNSWRWLALEGELCAVSDLEATLTTNGVLLTITADLRGCRLSPTAQWPLPNLCRSWFSPKPLMHL